MQKITLQTMFLLVEHAVFSSTVNLRKVDKNELLHIRDVHRNGNKTQDWE